MLSKYILKYLIFFKFSAKYASMLINQPINKYAVKNIVL